MFSPDPPSCGSQTWSIMTRDKRITAVEMRFLRGTVGYSHKRDETITKELGFLLISDIFMRNEKNWLLNVNRMDHSGTPI